MSWFIVPHVLLRKKKKWITFPLVSLKRSAEYKCGLGMTMQAFLRDDRPKQIGQVTRGSQQAHLLWMYLSFARFKVLSLRA